MSINLWKKWKGLKHWQKSGIIVAIIGVLLWYDPIHSIFKRHPEEIGFKIALLKSFLYSYIIVGTYISVFVDYTYTSVFINYILLILIYFIFGAAFGQIYYEIRHPTSLFDGSRIKARILTLVILIIYAFSTAYMFLLWFLY